MCDSPKLETTQMSVNRHLDKQSRVHPYDEILLSNKNDGPLLCATWMKPKVTALSERARPKKKSTQPVWFHLTLEKANRSIVTKHRSVVARGRRAGGRDRLQRGRKKLMGMMDMTAIVTVVCRRKSKHIKFYILKKLH